MSSKIKVMRKMTKLPIPMVKYGLAGTKTFDCLYSVCCGIAIGYGICDTGVVYVQDNDVIWAHGCSNWAVFVMWL